MKFFCALIMSLAIVSTHDMGHYGHDQNTRVRLVSRNNERQVLPQFVDEVQGNMNHLAVCGVDGKTYSHKDKCPVQVAYVGRCRPGYAYDTYWYMPHGWELYQPQGEPRRSRDLWGYHQHVMPPYYHA